MRARLLFTVVVAACAAPSFPAARFANAPPVTVVNDRLDVANAPSVRHYYQHIYEWDGIVHNRIARGLEVNQHRRALGVNALDEVPDSTWFTNRVGARDLSRDELQAGPVRSDNPDLHKPWTVLSTKVGGTEVGFIIRDARGVKFLLKFDQIGFAEQDTATHIIVNRFLWAIGYNVPEDFIVTLRRSDLELAPKAVIRDDVGREDPLTRKELEHRLDTIYSNPDGSMRGMASRWLPGKVLGGHPAEGVRGDDPNDRIPHQRRRDLRGLRVFAAWLDHVDVREGNFIDDWVTDPRDPHRHYVVHYMIDFGKSMGVMATVDRNPRMSFEYGIDLARMLRSLVTLGIEVRPWERRRAPVLLGVGLFEVASFEPEQWHNGTASYVPFLAADRFDEFWGAKIVMRFTREQIRAIVDAGQLTDPRSVEYLVDTLVARQRKIGAYWFARTNPLDRFAIDGDALCFDDLMLTYRLGPAPADTRYTIALQDRDARPLAATAAVAAASGRTCTAPLALAASGDGYTIAKITTTRPGFTGSTYVHVARDRATHAPRVIGIWRE